MLGVEVPGDIDQWQGRRVILRSGVVCEPTPETEEDPHPPELWARVHPNYLNRGIHLLLVLALVCVVAWLLQLNDVFGASLDTDYLYYGTNLFMFLGLGAVFTRAFFHFLAVSRFSAKIVRATAEASHCYRLRKQGWAPFLTWCMLSLLLLFLILLVAPFAGHAFEVLALSVLLGLTIGMTFAAPLMLFQVRGKRWQELMGVPEHPPEQEEEQPWWKK